MTADVPENDFSDVAPEKKVSIHVYATGKDIVGVITRRAPAADPGTRTVHVEVDIGDPDREIPVGTTGELRVDIGSPIPAVEIPLSAATIREMKASIFIVQEDTAHTKTFVTLGEGKGMLYAAPADVPPGTRVVTEGRALLEEGDRVTAKVEQDELAGDAASKPPAVQP
jgi:multidrug efflux pump subunit AcrA (membrane-fusion protein)